MNYPQDPETKATPFTLFGAIFFTNVLIVIFLALFIGFILFFFKRIVPAAIPVYCIVSDYPCYLKRKEFREMKMHGNKPMTHIPTVEQDATEMVALLSIWLIILCLIVGFFILVFWY